MINGKSSRKVLIGIAALAVVLIAAAIVLALQPPAEFDPATPEGTAQGYFRGVLDHDADLALGYLSDDLVSRCDPGEIRDNFRNAIADDVRVVIVSSSVDGDRARVEVAITETRGRDLVFSDSHRFEETLVMDRHGNRWVIAEQPWPIHYCPEVTQ